MNWGVGAVQHKGSVFASHPTAPGLILGIPEELSLDVVEINRWLSTAQNKLTAQKKLNNVERTNTVEIDSAKNVIMTNALDSQNGL